MAFSLGNRVKETSTTTGTGSLTLGGAASKYQAFADVMSTNDYCWYAIVHQSANEWEVGLGKLTSSTTLSRDTVINSSNSGSAVNFSGGTKDVFITDIAGDPDASAGWFGDGSNGDVTISSGTTTLTTDMYYKNLTIDGTGRLACGSTSFVGRVFVSEVLDLSNAPAGAIVCNGIAGSNGSGGTAGTGGGGLSTTGGQVGGSTGGANGSSGGSGGAGTSGSSASSNNPGNGAIGNTGGAGGAGSGGAGGGGGNNGSVNNGLKYVNLSEHLYRMTGGSYNQFQGGTGGGGGGSGGGNGSAAGGVGGGGGSGGGVLYVAARVIKTSGSTAAACIQANGGNGGNGASRNTNTGGGGGGGGGGAGWVYLIVGTRVGPAVSNGIEARGGTGGNGGNGDGSGTGGTGGGGGRPGRITYINLGDRSVYHAFSGTGGTSGSAGSGTSGGSGGAGAVEQTTL